MIPGDGFFFPPSPTTFRQTKIILPPSLSLSLSLSLLLAMNSMILQMIITPVLPIGMRYDFFSLSFCYRLHVQPRSVYEGIRPLFLFPPLSPLSCASLYGSVLWVHLCGVCACVLCLASN
ncbi:hypothetical protein ASPZODRAFT_194066 [Penicilliopsis zonata CBS 506.65]|uniref:Uncharacterized protein n=1 Tax=Penicilliopsis zonata CBS 506.65 TaxID=1073090 RepID=A0A1L9STG6_9EURO|nr:hypothetical protein ASPZODRAFT_194066 [Penicilliopsis zonata CBS 506.65]OJJ50502.1 hypothetical protein ASPZODRAFT_194066 [Penicilliopsis zonata CBS 506.65]